MTKKSLVFSVLACALILLPFLASQDYKIDVSTAKGTFEAGERITLKVSLLDSSNKPINSNVKVILEDSSKNSRIEKTILSNQFVDIDLEDKTAYGYWSIKAEYNGITTTNFFSVEENQVAKFGLENEKLFITNIGNTKYSKEIQIAIGENVFSKKVDLNLDETVSFRLIAPEGNYNLKIIADGKTVFTRAGIRLTGTGNIVEALDEKVERMSGITGTLSPEEESRGKTITFLENNKFVYVFILVIFGAMILLAVEKHYKGKLSK